MAIIPFEFRVEAVMPFIVVHSVVSFLRRRAYTKKHGDRAAEQHDEPAPFHSITSSVSASRSGGISTPSALTTAKARTEQPFIAAMYCPSDTLREGIPVFTVQALSL
jgi:hypothetical protein